MNCKLAKKAEDREAISPADCRTRGKRLLELVGLVGVLEDESVEVAVASDLEFDLVALARLLDAGGWLVVSIML